jgi:hypothetical protein
VYKIIYEHVHSIVVEGKNYGRKKKRRKREKREGRTTEVTRN